MNKTLRKRIALLACISLAVTGFAPASALAQGPTQLGYTQSQPLAQIESEMQSQGTDPSLSSSSEPESSSSDDVQTANAETSLPFTGFDTGLLAAMGVALLGAGFVMRRALRSSTSS